MSRTTASAKPQHIVEQPSVWNFDRSVDKKIIAFSGKLGAGKSICAKYLHSLAFMFVLGLTKHSFIGENGELVVMDAEGNYVPFDIDDRSRETRDFLAERVWPFMRKFSCADPLKQLCISVLGLDPLLVYGTQEDKNTLTHLKWEDMPTYVAPVEIDVVADEVEEQSKNKSSKQVKRTKQSVNKINRSGYMTVREVAEYVGTELFRRMENNCWANALVREITASSCEYALVDDVRFPNEVEAIQQAGGKVIRLTRISEEAASNQHDSNTALDSFDGFDAVIDNQNLSIEDTFRELIRVLTEWEYFKVVG